MGSEKQVDAFYASLGGRVKRGRRQANMSQADLAAQLGLSRASIANLEAGRQRPAAHQAVMIAEVLQIPIQDLLPTAPASIDPREGRRTELLELARSWVGAST